MFGIGLFELIIVGTVLVGAGLCFAGLMAALLMAVRQPRQPKHCPHFGKPLL